MSTADDDVKIDAIAPKKFRGIFTLVMLVLVAAAGGCYFTVILK